MVRQIQIQLDTTFISNKYNTCRQKTYHDLITRNSYRKKFLKIAAATQRAPSYLFSLWIRWKRECYRFIWFYQVIVLVYLINYFLQFQYIRGSSGIKIVQKLVPSIVVVLYIHCICFVFIDYIIICDVFQEERKKRSMSGRLQIIVFIYEKRKCHDHFR